MEGVRTDVTVEELRAMNVNIYVSLISITILAYEYYLTFVYEVERFWIPRVINLASFFFCLNRYLVLFGHIPVMLEYFWMSNDPEKLQMYVPNHPYHRLSYHQYLAIVIQIIVASMLIMRTYALYERSMRVLALYLFVGAAAVAFGCWAVIGGKRVAPPEKVLVYVGCAVSLSTEAASRLGAAWGGMLVFDSLVFGMTLYKSLTLPRRRGINLLSVLLRDGSLYFGVIVASNLANILTFLLGGPYTRGVMTTFTNIMSSVLISRLMLNLRDPALTNSSIHGSGSIESSTMYPNISTVVDPCVTEYSYGGYMSNSNMHNIEYEEYVLHEPRRQIHYRQQSVPSPSPKSSPLVSVQARRRSQYKSRTPSTPLPPLTSSSRSHAPSRAISGSGSSVFSGGSAGLAFGCASGEDSQKIFLREKFKARCFERAAKARAKAVRGRRYMGTSEASSDGFDDAMDEDDEEDDDDIMQDELFRRIMANTNRKDKHSYKVSYAQEVGSSFDPDMEDINSWEEELVGSFTRLPPPQLHITSSSEVEDLSPVDLDDEELEAYAEECAKRVVLEDFVDIPEEDLFSWSDFEDADILESRFSGAVLLIL
ncbi:hypothetical protein BDQ12DRAFT_720597 [Crucibulum laeve]|uniref:Uncharacterized protein n=1 Tax=Crucibulum laeve TaxID=68775 RepID=A0A5C3MAY6_9AGAR|nr:hypothetical protein BDQ12DRAFT_720597 [Crucibulum laeve]